jgi:hypothetical protein
MVAGEQEKAAAPKPEEEPVVNKEAGEEGGKKGRRRAGKPQKRKQKAGPDENHTDQPKVQEDSPVEVRAPASKKDDPLQAHLKVTSRCT